MWEQPKESRFLEWEDDLTKQNHTLTKQEKYKTSYLIIVI